MTTETATVSHVSGPETAPPHPLREFWMYFSANHGAVIGLAFILLLLFCAALANFIAPFPLDAATDPLQAASHAEISLTPPVWQEGGIFPHILGTDSIGRDLLSRLIFGARYSLALGAAVVILSIVVGTTLGLIAGFVRGIVEIIILRVMDIILTLPSLLLAMVIVAILGPGVKNAVVAVAIVILPHFVRLTRAAVITEVAKDYVTAAKVSGAGPLRLMVKEVLPNCMAPLIVQASLGMSTAILDIAALGFLNLGAQPPTPEWGAMLSDARELVSRAWWAVTFPGLAILLTVVAFNLLGDGLRDALDPKLKS